MRPVRHYRFCTLIFFSRGQGALASSGYFLFHFLATSTRRRPSHAKMSADLSVRVKMLTQRLSETNDRLHELGRLHRLANWLPEPEVQAEEQELQALYERDRHDRALLNKCIAGDKAAIAQLSKIDTDRCNATVPRTAKSQSQSPCQSQNPCQGQSQSQSPRQSQSQDQSSLTLARCAIKIKNDTMPDSRLMPGQGATCSSPPIRSSVVSQVDPAAPGAPSVHLSAATVTSRAGHSSPVALGPLAKQVTGSLKYKDSSAPPAAESLHMQGAPWPCRAPPAHSIAATAASLTQLPGPAATGPLNSSAPPAVDSPTTTAASPTLPPGPAATGPLNSSAPPAVDLLLISGQGAPSRASPTRSSAATAASQVELSSPAAPGAPSRSSLNRLSAATVASHVHPAADAVPPGVPAASPVPEVSAPSRAPLASLIAAINCNAPPIKSSAKRAVAADATRSKASQQEDVHLPANNKKLRRLQRELDLTCVYLPAAAAADITSRARRRDASSFTLSSSRQ